MATHNPVAGISRARRWWTSQEDSVLAEEVQAQLKTGLLKDWNRIANKLPGRTNKDCRKRWSKICNRVIKGTWSEEEDERLRAAVQLHGSKWTLVAAAVGTRHSDQCAKRWQQSLDPNIDHSKWTDLDEQTLLAAVATRGRNWVEIGAQHFPSRSPTDIKNRRRDHLQASNAGIADKQTNVFDESTFNNSSRFDTLTLSDQDNPYNEVERHDGNTQDFSRYASMDQLLTETIASETSEPGYHANLPSASAFDDVYQYSPISDAVGGIGVAQGIPYSFSFGTELVPLQTHSQEAPSNIADSQFDSAWSDAVEPHIVESEVLPAQAGSTDQMAPLHVVATATAHQSSPRDQLVATEEATENARSFDDSIMGSDRSANNRGGSLTLVLEDIDMDAVNDIVGMLWDKRRKFRMRLISPEESA